MQVLTANQVSQLQVTFNAMGEALEIIDYSVCHNLDRLLCIVTSDKAISAYRFTGKAIYHSVMLVCACAFYSGVLTRKLWNRFQQWADEFVDQCQQSEPVAELHIPDPEVEAAISLADELIQACEVADLLEIPASPQPIEADDLSLIALAKLNKLPGASKWSYTRKLRPSEREMVLQAIAC